MAEANHNKNSLLSVDKTTEEDDGDNNSVLNFLTAVAKEPSSSGGTKVNFLNKRHKTSPNITRNLNENSFSINKNTTPSVMLLPAKTTPRKSFFGELKDKLTFKKKNEVEEDSEKNSATYQSRAVRGRRKADFFETEEDPVALTGIADVAGLITVTNKVNTLQNSIKKWKLLKATEQKRETIATNSEHQKILDEALERFHTEVPHPLQIVIKEEALQIVTKTMTMYKSMLGSKHQLTKEANQHITHIKLILQEPSF